jgi:hypothetical protein
MMVVRLREETLNVIAAFGNEEACNQLLRLISKISPDDTLWIHARYVRAQQEWRRKSWVPQEPRFLSQTLKSRPTNLIQNDDDLLVIVMDSLERLQQDLQARSNANVLNYWLWTQKGHKKSNFRSKGEIEISALVAEWLRKDLGPISPLVLVEVQIQWNRRTDIHVIATTKRHATSQYLKVIIETKKSSNRDLQHACQSQLVDTYLHRSGGRHGIYLVVHLTGGKQQPDRSYLKSKSPSGMREEVTALARTAAKKESSLALRGFLLHVTLGIS